MPWGPAVNMIFGFRNFIFQFSIQLSPKERTCGKEEFNVQDQESGKSSSGKSGKSL